MKYRPASHCRIICLALIVFFNQCFMTSICFLQVFFFKCSSFSTHSPKFIFSWWSHHPSQPPHPQAAGAIPKSPAVWKWYLQEHVRIPTAQETPKNGTNGFVSPAALHRGYGKDVLFSFFPCSVSLCSLNVSALAWGDSCYLFRFHGWYTKAPQWWVQSEKYTSLWQANQVSNSMQSVCHGGFRKGQWPSHTAIYRLSFTFETFKNLSSGKTSTFVTLWDKSQEQTRINWTPKLAPENASSLYPTQVACHRTSRVKIPW